MPAKLDASFATPPSPALVPTDEVYLNIVVEGIHHFLISDSREVTMAEFFESHRHIAMKLLVVFHDLGVTELFDAASQFLQKKICGARSHEISEALLVQLSSQPHNEPVVSAEEDTSVDRWLLFLTSADRRTSSPAHWCSRPVMLMTPCLA